VFVCAIVASIWHRSVDDSAEPVAIPGWEELARCSDTASIDGTKELELREDQDAILKLKRADDVADQTIKGRWSFDESSKRYSVTVDGVTTTYSIVSPSSAPICMLIAGDITAAALRVSWFSLPFEDDDPRER
jgi:hypothetical protein